MSVAKVPEISASSPDGIEDAIRTGIARASRTIEGIQGAWVNEQSVVVKNDVVTEYRVNLRVTFVLKD